MTLTPAEMAVKLASIPRDYGKLFSVVFLKKDGSRREMTCRRGVKARAKGGKLSYDPVEKRLLTVFDMNAFDREGNRGAYRCIAWDRVLRLKIEGEEFEVAQ